MFNADDTLESVRERHELDEVWESSRRWHRFFVAALLVLAIGVGTLAWYGYPALRRQQSSLARVAGIEKSVAGLNQDLQKTGTELTDWAQSQEDLRQQMGKFRKEVAGRLEAAGKRTTGAMTAMVRGLQTQGEVQTSALQRKISELESMHEADAQRIGGLQQELDRVEGDVARQSDSLSATRRQVEENSATAERQFANLRDWEQRNRTDVTAMANKLAVERVDFEIPKGHSRQLAPGISVGLTSTDVPHQRVNGWMWIMPDRKTVWLRSQGLLQPLEFYGVADGKKRELVITRVAKESIVGYLVLPKDVASGSIPVAR